MKKRRLLLITTQSLFGTGIISLLEEQKNQLVIERVPDVKTAIEISNTFNPDVVVDFSEMSSPKDQALIQELVSRCQTRVIHCTLDANQITIYDKTRIQNATVEDLMSAVLK
ncbi:MAG: hypothetical protein HZA19_00365 [Nitrospirae bacterium]|nr:hypothetical protein [Nitrospirota bacterium]